MKTILCVLMIPAALFATWATSFVQDAVRQAKAESSGVEVKADQVKQALNKKVDTLRGSFDIETTEVLSVGAALRRGRDTVDRALGRTTRDRASYEIEKEKIARQIEKERAEIHAMLQEDARGKAVDPADLPPPTLPASQEETLDPISEKPGKEIEALETEMRDLERQIRELEEADK